MAVLLVPAKMLTMIMMSIAMRVLSAILAVMHAMCGCGFSVAHVGNDDDEDEVAAVVAMAVMVLR